MSQYYDPRQAARHFNLYAEEYRQQRIRDEKEIAEGKKTRTDVINLMSKVPAVIKGQKQSDVKRLLEMRDSNTITGRKFKPKPRPPLRGNMFQKVGQRIKEDYFTSPEDRVEFETGTKSFVMEDPMLNVPLERPEGNEEYMRNLIDQRYKEGLMKGDVIPPVVNEKVIAEAKLSDREILDQLSQGTYADPKLQAQYNVGYEKALAERGFNLDLTRIEDAPIVDQAVADIPEFSNFEELISARDAARGTESYSAIQDQINMSYDMGGGTYEGAKAFFESPDVTAMTDMGEGVGAITSDLITEDALTSLNNVTGEVANVTGEGMEFADEGGDLMGGAGKALGTISNVYTGLKVFDTLQDPNVSDKEKSSAVVDAGLDYASTKAIMSGNPYLMVAGVGYKLYDLLT